MLTSALRQVRTSLAPYVDSMRRLALDTIWTVCGIVVVLLLLVVMGQVAHRLMLRVHMVRIRKRIVFGSDDALKRHLAVRLCVERRLPPAHSRRRRKPTAPATPAKATCCSTRPPTIRPRSTPLRRLACVVVGGRTTARSHVVVVSWVGNARRRGVDGGSSVASLGLVPR